MRKLKKLNTSLMALLLSVLLAFPNTVHAETTAVATGSVEESTGLTEDESVTGEETGESGGETMESGGAEEELPAWPEFPYDLKATTAIVMDVDTGEVLYGKEIHSKRYPASITKILTALIVIENCSLSEEVTFTKEAVTNLESGAVTINTVAGDVMTVKDCLYALLLKSANEVANALAIHVAGSVPAFCNLMNEKARELGCLNSDFRNPNGLTNENHVTTAYDMALIASACMNNSTFMSLESEPTRKLAGTKNNPNGITVTIGHKMLKESEYYDKRVKAGKTGFTSAAGNTLVTMAEDNGRRIVAVVLKDSSPAHYTDTQKLLNYGFDSFENITPNSEKLLKLLGTEEKLVEDGKAEKGKMELSLWTKVTATVPKGTGTDTLTASYQYGIPKSAPENAVAYLTISSEGHPGTGAFLINSYKEPETTVAVEVETKKNGKQQPATTKAARGEQPEGPEKEPVSVPWKGIGAAAVIALAGYAVFLIRKRKKEEEKKAFERKQRRLERLQSMNMTEEEFAETVKENREKREKTSGENS